MAGIPTVVITREGFEGIVANAFAGFGFPAEAPVGYVFPNEMFLIESDLSPIEEHFDEFIAGMTDWEPETKEKGLISPETIIVKGNSYPEAIENVNNLFARNLWRDSLLITPPTTDIVDWILTGTDMDPDTVIGTAWPRGGIVTVHSIGVLLAMAGGRPEYLPFTIAAVKAMVDPRAGMQSWNSTTCSVFPAFIVSGPNSKDIRLGCGYGMLGPDPVHPAGGAIGRAVRLVQQNIGGAVPGTGTMSLYGGGRATNAVFAEDEEGIPEGWTSYAEDRGFTRDQNVVTITFVNSLVNVLYDFGGDTANKQCLTAIAGNMAAPNWNRLAGMTDGKGTFKGLPDLPSGVALIASTFASALVNDSGMSKEDVKNFLWENSKVPYDYVVSWGGEKMMKEAKVWQPGDMVAATPEPSQVTVVVGGGDQGGHGYWMAPATSGLVTSVEVELPANWDDLLFEAEIDLGPLPATK